MAKQKKNDIVCPLFRANPSLWKKSLQFSPVETNCQSFTMDGMVFHLVQLQMEMVYIRIMAGLTERLICNNLL